MLICISGQSGSGKTTTACAVAEALNLPVLHLDKIGELVWQQENIKEILTARLGNGILNNRGKIDVKKLGEIIFAKGAQSQREFHNSVVFPEVIKIVDSEIEKANYSIILDFKLLPAMKYWEMADFRIYIEAKVEMRFARMVTENKTDSAYLSNRDAAAPAITLTPPKVDYLIVNDGTKQQLMEQIRIGVEKIKAKSIGAVNG